MVIAEAINKCIKAATDLFIFKKSDNHACEIHIISSSVR